MDRAATLLRETSEEFRDFAQAWMAFNALYEEWPGREPARIRSCMGDLRPDLALAVLRECSDPIVRLSELPPGDMRRHGQPNFSQEAEEALSVVNGQGEPVARAEALAIVAYRIRCNLVHGSKDPLNPRDLMLARQGTIVVRAIVSAFLGELR